MLATNCPTCNRLQVFAWSPGMRPGFFPSRCAKCGKVMWTLGTSGETETYSHENFIIEMVHEEDLPRVKKAADRANVCSITDRKP